DSIMSIQLASAVRAAGFDLSPREIFERRTVRGMAAAITDTSARLPELAEPEGGAVGAMPLPAIVSWMLEHSDSATDFADFNQAVTLAAPRDLTVEVLTELVAELVAHHPMLSAAMVPSASLDAPRHDLAVAAAWQLFAGADFDAAAAVSVINSEHAVGTAGFSADLTRAHRLGAGRLDPATGSMVQAVLVTGASAATGDDTDAAGVGRIVLTIHHLSVDAVSWQAIIEDLVTLWAQRSQGHPYRLRVNTTSQRAWATAIAERAGEHTGEVGYWLERLPERPTDLGATVDRARDRVSTLRAHTGFVDATVTETVLTAAPEAFRSNVSDVLLAALARAVRSWQRDHGIVDDNPVSVLAEGHGRYEEVLEAGPDPVRADLSRSVGWFTSIAPLNLDPAADAVHAVKAAKEERLAQPYSGIGFGPLRYGAATELAARPLPSIVFNYLGAGSGGTSRASGTTGGSSTAAATEPLPFMGAEGPGYPGSPAGGMVAQGVLNINVATVGVDGGRRLSATVSYPAGVIGEADVADLTARWSAELADIAAFVAAGNDPGLSPSDVPGTDIGQADLDALAQRYPTADVWPLAPLQRGLFFEAELAAATDAGVDVYVAQSVVALGDIDTARLRSAADGLVAQHRVLRSGFVLTDSGAVVSVVPEQVTVPWSEIDLGDITDDAASRRVSEIATQQRVLPFDLAVPPLLRFVLVHYGASSTLIVTNHHLILDGWSGPLVMADLLSLYATGKPFTGTRPTDFGDYLRLIAHRDEAAGVQAWREVLAPVEGPTLVAGAVEASEALLPRDSETVIDGELITRVEAVAREHGATLATVLQAAWAVLLSRITGNQVVTFGETVSGRPADLDGVESMVGLFINTLPAVVDVDPSATIAQVLRRVQSDKVKVLDYQHLSLPDIAATSGSRIGFDTLVVHESYPVDAAAIENAGASGAGGLAVRSADFSDSTHYPLNMVTMPEGDGLLLRLKYLPAAFTEAQVQVFAGALVSILDAIAADPDGLTADMVLASADVLDAAVASGTGPVTTVPAGTVADALVARAASTPELSALWFEGRGVSYAELSARTGVLARELIAVGVGPDAAVGVCIDRSVEMVVAIHAVVAAGGQYVPIATDAPADRVRFMLETAGVGVVLVSDTSSHVVSRLVADAPHASTGNGATSSVEVPRAQASGVETWRAGNVRTIVVSCDAEVDL
ncbi:condensation domain-containing protein, partial [Gordonia sp. (in: high G+C Gram-positive bacteria)]